MGNDVCGCAQKQFAAERVGALLEDRKIRQDDFEASQAAAARKLDEMAARLKKAEDTLQHTTHDLILGAKFHNMQEDVVAHCSSLFGEGGGWVWSAGTMISHNIMFP